MRCTAFRAAEPPALLAPLGLGLSEPQVMVNVENCAVAHRRHSAELNRSRPG